MLHSLHLSCGEHLITILDFDATRLVLTGHRTLMAYGLIRSGKAMSAATEVNSRDSSLVYALISGGVFVVCSTNWPAHGPG